MCSANVSIVEFNQDSVQGVYKPNRISWPCTHVHLYLDTLHRDVVDHPNDATGPGYSQQRMACVGVVRPRTRIEVLICLCAHLVKEINTKNSPSDL